MSRPVRFRVVESEDGTLLHHLVARRLPDIDVAGARELVRGGAVYLGHLRVRQPTMRVCTGERVTVYPDALSKQALSVEQVRIVHRDPAFVVLDKPAGVPVAQTRDSSRGTLAEALRRVLIDEGVLRPYVGVVHRLDQGASGLVLFTVRSVANKSLHRQFVEHRIERRYRIRVAGDPPEQLRCDAPLVELRHGRVRVARDGESRARSASTEFVRLSPRDATVDGEPAALMDVRLSTGRTHQIRVHAQTSGFPVLGDRKYGASGESATPGEDRPSEDAAPPRLLLHAYALGFEHPRSGERVEVRAPHPAWALARSDADPGAEP